MVCSSTRRVLPSAHTPARIKHSNFGAAAAHVLARADNEMRLNENTAVATSKVLLVPYQARHVLKYHGWMQDPGIQEATASEPLSLHDEYENQASWRAARDKLTFIVCEPLEDAAADGASTTRARGGDAEERMRGDVNLFLYPAEDEDAEGDGSSAEGPQTAWLMGEVDVMIAATEHRGQGLGREAVQALLAYLYRHKDEILAEQQQQGVELKGVMAKIKQANAGSRALFDGLGFRQRGGVNYFGEVTVVKAWAEVARDADRWLRGYREVAYE